MKSVERVLEIISRNLGDAEVVVRVRNKSLELSVTTPANSWSCSTSSTGATIPASVLVVGWGLLAVGAAALVAAQIGAGSAHSSSSTGDA